MENAAVNTAALLTPPDIMKSQRILCVQPHPDDNEIGMGGVIAVLAKAGCDIHYLTVTDGSQGNLDQAAAAEETAKIRHQETIAAGHLLGAGTFHFLEHEDGSLADIFGLSVEIAEVIRRVRPEAVFCPDPWLAYEAHYDHIVVGRATANAFLMSSRRSIPDGGKTLPCPINAIGYYYTSNPNTVIDITDVFDTKLEAIANHKSQVDEPTLALYRTYFQMKALELAQDRDFDLGEGLKVLSRLHSHCFVDAIHL